VTDGNHDQHGQAPDVQGHNDTTSVNGTRASRAAAGFWGIGSPPFEAEYCSDVGAHTPFELRQFCSEWPPPHTLHPSPSGGFQPRTSRRRLLRPSTSASASAKKCSAGSSRHTSNAPSRWRGFGEGLFEFLHDDPRIRTCCAGWGSWISGNSRGSQRAQSRRMSAAGKLLEPSAPLVLRDAIEVFSPAEVEFVADHDRGSVEAVVELVEGQQLELRAARDDGDAAFAPGDVYASGGAHG